MTDELSRLVPFTPPERLAPMDRDQFAFAFQLAHSAASLAMPVENPAQFGVNLGSEESDEVTSLRFTDAPINRAMFAAKNHFGKDIGSFMNFSMRFFAMYAVIRSDNVKKWIKEDKTDPRVTLLLDREGQFNLTAFFAAVERIVPTLPKEE